MKKLTPAPLLIAALAGCPPADDQRATVEIEVSNIAEPRPIYDLRVADQPVDVDEAGPLMPGEEYVVTFRGRDRLSIASMFIPSNDTLFAFADDDGIPLYDASGPLAGDITDQIALWNAGTEVDVAPGEGPDQAPDQAGPDTGADEDGVIRPIADDPDLADDYPAVSDVLEAEVAYLGNGEFELTVRNVSSEDELDTGDGTRPVLISPLVVATHDDSVQIFTEGEMADDALESLAEDGDPMPLVDALEPLVGITPRLSPPLIAIHDADVSVFEVGSEASGALEQLAEDGAPQALADSLRETLGLLDVQILDQPTGPIEPGNSRSVSVEVTEGQRITVLSMFIPSNDWFYGSPNGEGFDPFPGGDPLDEPESAGLELYDAGTEVDQVIGAGDDQAPFQPAPDTGEDEDGTIERVDLAQTEVDVPDASDVVELTFRVSDVEEID